MANQAKQTYAYKFKNNRYDLIISSDDKAFHFLRQYGLPLSSSPPIVFCGVNNNGKIQLNNPLMTGIVEGYDIDGTIELALMFHPKLKHIYYLNDTTITGRSVERAKKDTRSALMLFLQIAMWLTNIPNRRACFSYLNQFVADTNQDGTKLVSAFLDISIPLIACRANPIWPASALVLWSMSHKIENRAIFGTQRLI